LVMRWEQRLKIGGLSTSGELAREAGLRHSLMQRSQGLARLLKVGSIAAAYTNEMWTLARISPLVEARFNVRFDCSSMSSLLDRMWWSVQRPPDEYAGATKLTLRPESAKGGSGKKKRRDGAGQL
jgi:hypothetical protein